MTYENSLGRTRKWNSDWEHEDRTYFINAFLLVKGTRQEEAGHGLFLLGEEDKILSNAHRAPEREAEMGYSPRDSKAHLRKEQIPPLDVMKLPSEGSPKGLPGTQDPELSSTALAPSPPRPPLPTLLLLLFRGPQFLLITFSTTSTQHAGFSHHQASAPGGSHPSLSLPVLWFLPSHTGLLWPDCEPPGFTPVTPPTHTSSSTLNTSRSHPVLPSMTQTPLPSTHQTAAPSREQPTAYAHKSSKNQDDPKAQPNTGLTKVSLLNTVQRRPTIGSCPVTTTILCLELFCHFNSLSHRSLL